MHLFIIFFPADFSLTQSFIALQSHCENHFLVPCTFIPWFLWTTASEGLEDLEPPVNMKETQNSCLQTLPWPGDSVFCPLNDCRKSFSVIEYFFYSELQLLVCIHFLAVLRHQEMKGANFMSTILTYSILTFPFTAVSRRSLLQIV